MCFSFLKLIIYNNNNLYLILNLLLKINFDLLLKLHGKLTLYFLVYLIFFKTCYDNTINEYIGNFVGVIYFVYIKLIP